MTNNDIKIAVLGGDMRMLFCAKELAAKGFEVCVYGFDPAPLDCGGAVRCRTVKDAVQNSAVVILPVPYSTDGCRLNCPFSRTDVRIDDLFAQISPTQLVLAGVCGKRLFELCENLCISVTDYMKDEELTVKNAVPTAEGALEIALKEMPFTLHGSNVLITGFGRVGKACADVFSALHCSVTVCAKRAEALAWADVYGYGAADISNLPEKAANADLIINTAPALLFDKSVLSEVKKDALIIDLSSEPGGVDKDVADKTGVRVIHALSLPGKTAPLTAGKYIAQTVISIMKKRGVL